MEYFYFFVGTTAEFIKLFPVIKEIKQRKKSFKIITSGQNKILFKEMKTFSGEITSDISLSEKDEKSSIIHFGFWAVKTFFISLFVLQKEFKNKDRQQTYFIVHGDTVSSLLGALIARFYSMKLVHIESGLRSFNFFEPFPEELCRWIVSNLSDIHFCPNSWSVKNLKGKKGEKINTLQNTLIESLTAAMQNPTSRTKKLKRKKNKYFILVIHRQEHVIFRKNQTKLLLEFILQNMPKNIDCVFIMHELTAGFLHTISSNANNNANVMMVPRLSYDEFAKLMKYAEFMITDGGSNQEEAYYLGKPCLILRNVTERIEGLNHNAVLSKKQKSIIKHFIDNFPKYKQKPIDSYQKPSAIIVDYLLNRKGNNG